MDRRPNILFLMSDEHRADITGYEGNSTIRTPVLDKLANTGIVFKNAYTPSPVCVPGRMCMMAGQLPRTCRCENYGEDLTPGYMTFARRFSQYAYHTVACGKLHHMGSDFLQGWSMRIGGHDGMEKSHVIGIKEEEEKKYSSILSDGTWSNIKEIKRAGITRSRNTIDDNYTVQGALDFIEKYFNDTGYDKQMGQIPLLLKVSLVQPHYPYFTTSDKFGYYLNRVKPFIHEEVFKHPVLEKRQVKPGADVTYRELQRAVAAYYGMIETIDDHFGKILNALEYVGQDLDDWIIVYTSDHGEMLGEHGIWEKFQFFESSVRVPLIIRWPNGFNGGRQIKDNVNLCDLFATLCELAGISIPENLDSRSMVPLIKSDSYDWNNESVSQLGSHLMIKVDNLKYQYYGPDIPEVLFDLSKNPEETVNYIDDPLYGDRIKYFRRRAGTLGYGPYADPGYKNAGYNHFGSQ